MALSVEQIAEVCHAALVAYERVSSGGVAPPWPVLPKASKLACIDKVNFVLKNPMCGPQAVYDYRRAEDSKHFDNLTYEKQERIFMFIGIVRSFQGWRPEDPK